MQMQGQGCALFHSAWQCRGVEDAYTHTHTHTHTHIHTHTHKHKPNNMSVRPHLPFLSTALHAWQHLSSPHMENVSTRRPPIHQARPLWRAPLMCATRPR